MVIVYGHRSFGRVHGHGGEFAQTDFAHLYYMPIIPMSSFWVTRTDAGSVRGFEIRLCMKSVIATYLRWWGPLAALIVFALAPGVIGAVAAAPIVAAIIYAWRWRSVRTARARRQSDVERTVFGSRCPPALISADMRREIRGRLDARWSKISGGRSPEDVVRFGARAPMEGLLAYGLLRLASVEHGDASAGAAADRLLDGLDPEPLAGSPYRGEVGVAFAPAIEPEVAIEDEVAAEPAAPSDWNDRTLCAFGDCVGVIGPTGACKACGKRPGVDIERPRTVAPQPRKRWWAPPLAPALGIAIVVGMLASLGLVKWGAVAWRSTTVADVEVLLRHTHPAGYIEVTCDRLELVGDFDDGTKGYTCATGYLVLPVAGALDDLTPGTKLVGELHSYGDGGYLWPADLRSGFPATPAYLDVRSHGVHVLHQVACVSGLVGVLAFGTLIAIIMVRRRRAGFRRKPR